MLRAALSRAVMDVVERWDFGGRAMFMSLDYPSLLPLLDRHPEWWVGYCAYSISGDLTESVWQYGMDFLAVGVFQALGKGKYALVFALLRKIVLEIPALILLNKLFPLYGLAYAQLTAELMLAIAAVIVLVRLFRKLEKSRDATATT